MIVYQDDNDEQLFVRIAGGDEKAFRAFFYRYNTKVYSFILHIVKSTAETEELTQDVFLRLWVSRKLLGSVDNAGNYLFVMARNRSLDHLEKRVAEKNMKQRLTTLLPYQSDSVNEDILYRQSRELIAKAVMRLPAQQRRIYCLSKELGLTRQEIAARLSISPNTVKNHLQVAVKSIQQYLRQEERTVLSRER